MASMSGSMPRPGPTGTWMYGASIRSGSLRRSWLRIIRPKMSLGQMQVWGRPPPGAHTLPRECQGRPPIRARRVDWRTLASGRKFLKPRKTAVEVEPVDGAVHECADRLMGPLALRGAGEGETCSTIGMDENRRSSAYSVNHPPWNWDPEKRECCRIFPVRDQASRLARRLPALVGVENDLHAGRFAGDCRGPGDDIVL